jgi:plasmid stabilization system protein ParE
VTDRISFDLAAQRELDEAADFYDLESPGLGTEFLDVVETTLTGLLDFPESSPILLGETRKLVLERFPYSVMYWTDGEVVAVYAIAHHSRRPGYWRDRI